MTSNWADATMQPFCHKCHAMNLEPPAKPTIVREQDGTWTCAQCGASWRPGETPKEPDA